MDFQIGFFRFLAKFHGTAIDQYCRCASKRIVSLLPILCVQMVRTKIDETVGYVRVHLTQRT